VGVKSRGTNNILGLAIDNGKAAKVVTQSLLKKRGKNLSPPTVLSRMLLPD
jgi:hypothetical protein